MRKEPLSIVLSNLRRFERMIGDQNTSAVTQTVLTKLIAEERAKLAAAEDDAARGREPRGARPPPGPHTTTLSEPERGR